MPKIRWSAAIAGSALILATAVIAVLTVNSPARASRVVALGEDLYLIDETLGEKRLTTQRDIKFLFDQKGDVVLYGRGWEPQNPESEDVGGTRLYVRTLDGREDRFIAAEVRHAFFDRAGKTVYFVNRQADLFAVEPGSAPRKIQEKVLAANLSPDGKRLVYQKLNPDWAIGQYYDSALGLTVMDVATGAEHRVTTSWMDFNPFWTPDGKKILFFSPNEYGTVSHVIMNADGSGRAQLTNIGEKYSTDRTVPNPSERPIWSKDGRYFVYEADREIWLVEFAPGHERIVDARPLAYGKRPEWTADGRELTVLVSKNRTAPDRLIRIDLKGTIKK